MLPIDIFNEQMTSSEAMATLFKAVEGKTAEEIEKVKAAYSAIISTILEKESRLASEGWFID